MDYGNGITREFIFQKLSEILNSKKQITIKEAWELGIAKNNSSLWIIIINLKFPTEFIMKIIKKANDWTVTLAAIKTEKLSKAQLMEIVKLQGSSALVFIEATNRILNEKYKKRN